MLPWTLLHEGKDRLKGRNVVWFVDNASALYSAVKGSSRNGVVRRAIFYTNMLAYAWDISIWWEFVDSESNWADGISRVGAEDEFVRRHGFSPVRMQATAEPWKGSVSDAWSAVVGSCGGG